MPAVASSATSSAPRLAVRSRRAGAAASGLGSGARLEKGNRTHLASNSSLEANVTCSGSMSISSIDLVALFTATACAEATRDLSDRFAPRRANAREDAAEAVPCTWPFCAATTRVEA